MLNKKIMVVPCIVKSWLYVSGAKMLLFDVAS